MHRKEDEYHRSFRNARANLSALCHATTATAILDRNQPVAFLVPFQAAGYDRYTTKDRRIAAARKLFEGALERMRTP